MNHAYQFQQPTVPLQISLALDAGRQIPTVERFGEFATRCHGEMRDVWWQTLADLMAVPVSELIRLRIGWSSQHSAMTWPMFDQCGDVVGIQLQCMLTGHIRRIPGSQDGLFIPSNLPSVGKRLFITESLLDCAALSALGFPCVGRSTSRKDVLIAGALVERLAPDECVIIANRDKSGAAMRSAESLSVALVTVCPATRIIFPPEGTQDLFEWVLSGATVDDILQVVETAPTKTLKQFKGGMR